MAINNSETARRKQAAEDLADKLKLEKRMEPRVRKIFRRMADDLEANVLLTGSAQSSERYATSFNGVIDEQYEDSKSIFGPQLFDQLEDEPADGNIWAALIAVGAGVGLTSKDEILPILRANGNARSNDFIQSDVPKATSSITRTNSKDLAAAVDVAAINLSQELGRSPTRPELAEATRKEFLKHDLGRTTTIVMTATQDSAEGIKHINVNVLTDYRTGSPGSIALPPPEMNEFWDAILDQVTRIAHAQADGDEKRNGVFIVAGESLRFPGDQSLGASIGNTINCRCAAIFSYDEPNF